MILKNYKIKEQKDFIVLFVMINKKRFIPFIYYDKIDKCKQCGKRSGINTKGFCFWCQEEIDEGLYMLKDEG